MKIKNLFSGRYVNGYLDYNDDRLKKSERLNSLINGNKYRTTEWFDIDAAEKFLVMSGDAFNRAVWQFELKDGSRCFNNSFDDAHASGNNKNVTPIRYRRLFGQKPAHTCARVCIPKEALRARVYYANYRADRNKQEQNEITLPLGERLYIQYGLIPQNLKHYDEKYPDWLSALLEKKDRQVRIYGIRHKLNDPDPLCERIADSSDMKFNYEIDVCGDMKVQNRFFAGAAEEPNDFDSAFPFCNIKQVYIKDDGSILNVSDVTGSNSQLDKMAEIPLHYVRREVTENFEYVLIADGECEGFVPDPSFVGKHGISEKIYIGAYQSSEDGVAFRSTGSTFVSLRHSFIKHSKSRETLDNRNGIANGKFHEIDACALFTIIRLFLIETATLDSQSIFAGNVNSPFMTNAKEGPYFALESAVKANSITVLKTTITARFRKGDAAAVLPKWQDNYENVPGKVQRVITDIYEKKCRIIKNGESVDSDCYEIHFDGEPADIVKGKTKITGLPAKNGMTDVIPYHTGMVINNCDIFDTLINCGHEPFKYRGIENLYGNVWIFIGGVRVKNGRCSMLFPDGMKHSVNWKLPVQEVPISTKLLTSNKNASAVCLLGIDKAEPLIMLPREIGGKASLNSFYADSWTYEGKPDTEYVMTYGGAWDNLAHAGLFCFRASFTIDDKMAYNGGRLMYTKQR